MKILIIGHAGHGKDTFANILFDLYGLNFKSSSFAAAEIFIYDILKDIYGYKNMDECFIDRVNHRAEWYDLIDVYNLKDGARLAKKLLEDSDIYVGMRSDREIKACKEQKIFDLVIGLYDPRKPEESKKSFKINLWENSDIIIPNSGTIPDLISLARKLHYGLKL